MPTTLEVRQAMVDRGFTPIPVTGKVPPFKSWQTVGNVTHAMLVNWGRNWPRATNTGVLTRVMPTIDIDVLNEPAAIAVEELVRERFEERGYVLTRIGRAPKRAIIFRTIEPFAKLTTNFVSADGEKIEFLGDGQQVVAHGIHPDTLKPYSWFGGDPTSIAYDDLPYISAEEAEQLQRDVTGLLVRDFGYVVAAGRAARKANGTPQDHAVDWQSLIDNISAGNDLHASTRDLAAKMARSGMDGGAIVNFLRGLMDSSAAPHDERWQQRYDNLPRQVDTIQQKLEREQAATNAVIAPPPRQPPPPPPPASPGATPSAAPGPLPGSPIEDVLKIFREWLLLDDDTPVLAMLGTVAANMLPGDAIWLGIIAPPSSAKTEMLITLANIPHTEMVGTLSVAGLLSGTPRRQQAAGSKGGLLQKIGAFGFLVLKDFGSILSMRPEAKAELLAALREVYDGKWTRIIGADGGRTLQWAGKIGLLFGCTRVYDSYYGVISELGDRFLLCRMEPNGKQFHHAIRHANRAPQMRARLVEAVTDLFAHPLPPARDISDREINWMNDILQIAVRLRGAVKRDYRTRELEDIYGAEGAARLGKALERVLSGLDCLGVQRSKARRVVRVIAFDSVPPNRLSTYRHLKSLKGRLVGTTAIAKAVTLPTITARRALEELVVYGLAERHPQGQGQTDLWRAI
ncbi:bifunctional DNA primase/polymerase [Bradyrhizobium sp. McL0616]|uniref:bifunctional DNA primase/polymerase n=1 Tax=Bradyrhizobium sp. McL0616 TaxID=3415674 RepID=UPI003CEA6C41